MDAPSRAAPRRQSPAVAALLSFVWPGLGQAYAGRRRAAALFAIPAAVVLLWGLWQLRRGPFVAAAQFAEARFALTALLLVIATGMWRLAAVGHAYTTAGTSLSRTSRGQLVALGVLLALVIGAHGVGAFYVSSVYGFDQTVFTPGATPGPSLVAGSSPGGSQSSSPESTPFAPPVTPAPGSSRLTILLTGVDSAPGRVEHLNDTLLVISVDTAKKTVAMISVPRDTSAFPYYWGGTAPNTMKINSLVTLRNRGIVKSPDDPTTTLIKEIAFLVGVPINYYATVDLQGFAGLINKVGGVDVNNPKLIDDPHYDWLDGSPYGFRLSAGKHHLNGRLALAYVRSRQGAGDNDYTRSSRQQEVAIALEKKLATPQNALNLPALLNAAGPVVRTNFPADRIDDMVEIAQQLPPNAISQFVLGPPYSRMDAAPNSGTWTSCLRMDKVAALSVQLFGTESRYYGLTGLPSTCGG